MRQGFPLGRGRVNRSSFSMLSYCILTLWKGGGSFLASFSGNPCGGQPSLIVAGKLL